MLRRVPRLRVFLAGIIKRALVAISNAHTAAMISGNEAAALRARLELLTGAAAAVVAKVVQVVTPAMDENSCSGNQFR